MKRFWLVAVLFVVALLAAGCGSNSLGPGETPTPAPLPTELPPTNTSAPTLVATTRPTEPQATATPEPAPTATPMPTSAPPTSTTEPTPGDAGDTGNADVVRVRAVETASEANASTWTFHVTVEHPDTGWDDYADGWDVVTPDGEVLKPDPDSPFTRLLLHPHENEQPFTRSQSGIVIAADITQVRVRAHDLVDGFGGREVTVDLTAASGPDFEVERMEE
ncbi:MAG: hypothetical protein PVG54_06370 [Anaerolineae bacterium]|jgi:hypothetical protein